MSNFVGKFIEHLFALSPYSKDYDFKDHVVVIGDMTNDKRRDFMEELIENDIVERDMNNPMGQLSSGIKCIFVSEKEPSSQMRMQAIYYTDKHDNEIVFLKDNIYSQGKKWYKKANLKEAKIMFAFSKECDNEQEGFEQDKLMSLTAKNVKDAFPKLRVMLVLMTEFKQLIDMDSQYADIENISPRQMNEFLLATSLENPGLSTTLQHLLTMKSKTVSKEILQTSAHDQFLFSYIQDMQSEIYQVQVPDFFVGMSFRKCAQVLYLNSVNVLSEELELEKFIQTEENQQMINLIAIETSAEENFNTMENESLEKDKEAKQVATFGDWPKRENTKTPSTQLGVNKSGLDNLLMRISESENQQNKNLNEQQFSSRVQANPSKREKSEEVDATGKQLVGSLNENNQPHLSQQSQQQQASLHNYTIDKIKSQTQILINPQNYTIRKNDICYVVCDNHEDALNIKQLNSVNCEQYKRFHKNYLQIKRSVGNFRLRKSIIEEMFQQLIEKEVKNKDSSFEDSQSDRKPKELEKRQQSEEFEQNNSRNDEQQSSSHKQSQISEENSQESEDDDEDEDKSKLQVGNADILLGQKMYDFNELQFPEIQLKNHIIIIGKINKQEVQFCNQCIRFGNYINLLRKYSNRSIVLFTQDQMSLNKWNEKRSTMPVDTERCYIFKGQYLNLLHINSLGIQTSYQVALFILIFIDLQILLSTQLFSEEFPDAIGICLARIIQDYYGQSNFLIELLDDEKLQFLRKNIKFKNLKQVPPFLYSTFMQGRAQLFIQNFKRKCSFQINDYWDVSKSYLQPELAKIILGYSSAQIL